VRVVRDRRIGWVGVAVILSLASLTIAFAPGRSPVQAVEGPEAAGIDARTAEEARTELRREFLRLTNEDRAEHDRRELRLAQLVSRYATRHSGEMADAGRIFHSSEDELRQALAGVDWSYAGENVGVGSSLENLQGAFMASPDHRANVLRRPYDHAAVGVVVARDRVWVTVVFYGD
jgi:uncharacterized protein YkwD